jgi:hypothetical protein
MKSALIISPQDEQTLQNYISELFAALKRLNWIRLDDINGSVWQTLNQIESYLNTKQEKTGPVIKYLREFYASFKIPVYKSIMIEYDFKDKIEFKNIAKSISDIHMDCEDKSKIQKLGSEKDVGLKNDPAEDLERISSAKVEQILEYLNAAIDISDKQTKEVLNSSSIEPGYNPKNNKGR